MSKINRMQQGNLLEINNEGISATCLLETMRRQGGMKGFIQEWILERELRDVDIPKEIAQTLLMQYRSTNNLNEDKIFEEHLQDRHINEELLQKMLIRPHKIVAYRNDRWGPAVESLYLKNKEKYDKVKYWRLEASNANVMQEVYFRIKDGEETWESMAAQFQKISTNAKAKIGPMPTQNVEPQILSELLSNAPGKVIQPIKIGINTAVVSLISFTPSELNEDLKRKILQETFDDWLQNEYKLLSTRISFSQS